MIDNYLFDEIETGKRGIIDLINEYDARIEGVPLAAYINSSTPGGKPSDARLIEFYQDDPR